MQSAKPEDAHADCWAFAVVKCREISFGRVQLPEDFADALKSREAICDEVPAGEAPRRGDLLEMETQIDGKMRAHVAVCVSAFRALHFVRGPGVLEVEIRVARLAGQVKRVMRPREGVPA